MEHFFRIVSSLAWGTIGSFYLIHTASAENEVFLHQLPQVTGITFEVENSPGFRVATPYGMFIVSPDGKAVKYSQGAHALMELVSHPTKPMTMFSSGYKSKTQKLGIVRSDNGGQTWKIISAGAKESVAFRAMAISPTDPSILYGVDGDIQTSRDGGKTWSSVGQSPADIFDIAVSSIDPATVYAATRKSLQVSRDSGKTWSSIHESKFPATMVNVAAGGKIHAFIYRVGLVAATEPDLKWTLVSKDYQDRALMNMSVDPKNNQRIIGIADTGAAMVSSNGGKSWTGFEGSTKKNPDRLAKGKALYGENCEACHGVGGIGENPKDPSAKDEFGFKAPALNDDAHAWHHADEDLVKTILNGSPRNERMIAWKEHMSAEDAENIVVYMKSLWSFRSLACQGGRHMKCMH